ncbi:hypothetical protein ABZP36_019593 [Zizania latifolia]
MIHEVQRTAQASLLSWLDHPSIELKDAVSNMIFSVTAKKLISYDSSTSNEEMWKHYDAFIRGLVAFPLYIPGTAFYKCMQGRRSVMKMLKELLDERTKATHRRENIDFIDVLIEELEKDTMSENAALDLVFLLLFASFETTSSAITAVLRFLTDNPKALQELTVIHEALRLANIAPVMFRKATEDVRIKGYAIPKGSKIMICPSTVHLNPVNTDEPAGGASKDFMAFGGGLRLCVGADFAKLQMAIFLHCVVTKYRYQLQH